MKKSDVRFHRDGYGPSHPAVSVKMYNGCDPPPAVLEELAGEFGERPARFLEAVKAATDSQREDAYRCAVENGWEQLQELAREVFGPRAEVYSEGRSSGWAVVHGLPDFDSWSGPEVAKWGRFARRVKQGLVDFPRSFAWHLWANVLEPDLDEHDEAAAHAADVDTFAGPACGTLQADAGKGGAA